VADGVRATFIHADIDAGITSLRYAIGDRVWLDLDADGAQQPDEPPATATVSLLKNARVLATTVTDADGRFRFTGLEAGVYQVRFQPGEHRRFTARQATSDPALDSDADPRSGTTRPITVGPGAAALMPAADLGVADADLVNATVSAGLVGAYRVGDLVWRDDNGNGVLDSGEPGLPDVRVDLLDSELQIVRRAVTTDNGRFAFGDLAAGTYRLRFLPPGKNLVFTSARTGRNPAVDSDVDSAGLSGPVVLGDENPADTTVDAGLTSPVNLTVATVAGGAAPAPVDNQLSSTGGVAVSIPIAGLALVVSGLSCLLAARRSPLP
jgi:5-hydroxyisourate hydrolase-like protein (transthyretin family)